MIFGRVYSIRSHQTNDIYIGSTTQLLSKRMVNHRDNYKQYLRTKKMYVSSFEILKYNDAFIELIFEGEFESKDALRKYEGQSIREHECVNKRIAGRTRQEYDIDNKDHLLEVSKNYKEKNKERILQVQKKYGDTHKEQKAEYRKQKITCECGSIICIGDKSTHFKTKKHQAFLHDSLV